MDKDTAVILTQSKSTGVAVVLTLLFGGLGLFYVGATSAIFMTIIEVILMFITFITLGFGIVLLLPFHIVALILAITGVNRHNAKLISSTCAR
ncbi:hypothetical protein JCM14469_30300 [Desulfatiferula olefinivorans]